MAIAIRIFNTVLLIAYSVFPSARRWQRWKSRTKSLEYVCPAGCNPVNPEEFHKYITDINCTDDLKTSISIFIPRILPLAAPFILAHLKKTGFSGCRAEVIDEGIAVKAVR